MPGLGVFVFVLPAAITKTRTERIVVLNADARQVISVLRGCHPEYRYRYPM